MKTGLYSLYDMKADYYSKPFYSSNDDVAIRNIQNAMQDQQTQESEFVKNPQDFSLYTIGTWDDNTGIIESSIKKVLDLTSIQKVDDNEK